MEKKDKPTTNDLIKFLGLKEDLSEATLEDLTRIVENDTAVSLIYQAVMKLNEMVKNNEELTKEKDSLQRQLDEGRNWHKKEIQLLKDQHHDAMIRQDERAKVKMEIEKEKAYRKEMKLRSELLDYTDPGHEIG